MSDQERSAPPPLRLDEALDVLDRWIGEQTSVESIIFSYVHDNGGSVTVSYERRKK